MSFKINTLHRDPIYTPNLGRVVQQKKPEVSSNLHAGFVQR